MRVRLHAKCIRIITSSSPPRRPFALVWECNAWVSEAKKGFRIPREKRVVVGLHEARHVSFVWAEECREPVEGSFLFAMHIYMARRNRSAIWHDKRLNRSERFKKVASSTSLKCLSVRFWIQSDVTCDWRRHTERAQIIYNANGRRKCWSKRAA